MSPELNDPESNRHTDEVPMPEKGTGDVQPAPVEPPHMPGPASPDANPAHPPSEKS